MDFSIVIPTWNRSHLVDELLQSLFEERKRYTQGKTEVLIVDSSKDEEQCKIRNSCKAYDAVYIVGDDSVRKKRNKGIKTAKYEYILFIDSDVTCRLGLLDEYVKAYRDNSFVNLGGVLGYTEFVGPKTFWWKMLELTQLVDSFSFARNYPFHSWTIGNNVSFKKSVLEEVGMFEENFPFKLGGDDLEMTYRITKTGYMIGSAPEAVTYHSRETWNNWKAIYNRAKRWGTMEYLIVQLHPELYKTVVPRSYLLEGIGLLAASLAAVFTGNSIWILSVLFWILINALINYGSTMKSRGFINPIHYIGARLIAMCYEFYRVKSPLTHRFLSGFYKGMVFNVYQIRFSLVEESRRINQLMWTFLGAMMLALILV